MSQKTPTVTDRDNQLNVMQAILTLERAGAQEVVRTLTEHLQKKGCNLVVCAFQDGPMRAEIEQLGVKVEILERPRYSVFLLPMFLLEMRRIRRQLARLIKTYQIDVIQTHILQVLDFLVLSLRRDTNLRVVLWTMQNVEFLPKGSKGPKRFVYRLLYRLLSGRVDGFIAVSEEVRKSILQQVGPSEDKIHTICNAVNLETFRGSTADGTLRAELGFDSDDRLIAVIGRLTEQKGHRYIVEAAKTVVSSCPRAHLLFVGDGELRRPLWQQVRQAGLEKNVHFLGVRSDVPRILAAVDLFAMPSLWEGLSVALLEAMAAGKPIIATEVSGTVQALTHGKTGLLVPPRDSDALAQAVLQLLSDPVRAQTLGQVARQHVESVFGAEKQAKEHLTLYRRLLRR